MICNYSDWQYAAYWVTGLEDIPTPTKVQLVTKVHKKHHEGTGIALIWTWGALEAEIVFGIGEERPVVEYRLFERCAWAHHIWVARIQEQLDVCSADPPEPYLCPSYWYAQGLVGIIQRLLGDRIGTKARKPLPCYIGVPT